MNFKKSVYLLVISLIFITLFNVTFLKVKAVTGKRDDLSSEKIIFIRAGRLFDSEEGKLLSARDIIIKGNLIENVGENLAVPQNAQVIDLKNKTVLPGLIDAHTHLLYLENPNNDTTLDNAKAVIIEGAALRALRGAARGRTFLMAGITTVRDLGNSGRFADVALRTAIIEGSVDGPRMYVSGPGLSPEGGQFPRLQYNHKNIVDEEYRIVKGVDDARQAVRENVTYGANVIKIYSDNAPNITRLSVEEMKAIVNEAHSLGIKVTAHAVSDKSVFAAVEAGVDSIEHGYQLSDATIKLMKQNNVALVPTDLDKDTLNRISKLRGETKSPDPEELDSYLEISRERLRRAVKAGVPIVAGSDNYLDLKQPQGEGAKKVLFAYLEAGMLPTQILQSATINAAKLFGNPYLGIIKKGCLADIIAVEGDPTENLQNIERVKFVMKDGRIYLGQSLD